MQNISKISSLIFKTFFATIYLMLLSPFALLNRKDLLIREIITKIIVYPILVYFFGISNPWIITYLSLEAVLWTYAIIMSFNKKTKEKLINYLLRKIEHCDFIGGMANYIRETYDLN